MLCDGAANSASLGSCSILTCAGVAALKADALQCLEPLGHWDGGWIWVEGEWGGGWSPDSSRREEAGLPLEGACPAAPPGRAALLQSSERLP